MIYYELPSCTVQPLTGSTTEIEAWSRFVNLQLTTEHLHTGSQPMRTIDVEKKWADERAEGDILFAVYCGERFIGTCGLHNFRWIYHSAEHRYLIFDPEFVGKGIGTQICKTLLWHGFKRLNLHKQWLGVSAKNERAIACYKKCGFVEEARLRDELYVMGEYVDALRMSVLRPNWCNDDPRKA